MIESRSSRWCWYGVELAASVTTAAGMWIGSTTLEGAAVYLLSTAIWCAITIHRRLLGIWPLNILCGSVSIFNLYLALSQR